MNIFRYFHLYTVLLIGLQMGQYANLRAQENGNIAPVAKITINPGVVVIGDDFQTEVRLDARSSYDLDGHLISFKWELNGGRILEGADSVVAIATFPGIRDYPVTLTVTDDLGATAVANSVVIAKNNQAPQARIQIIPPVVVEGDNFETQVLLDGRSSFDIDGTVESFEWELDGGRILEGADSSVALAVFPGVRNYPVTLTVTDNNGATTTAQDEIVVGPIRVREFVLIDSETGEAVRTLTKGDTINEANFPQGFNIVAKTNPREVGSVAFTLNGKEVRVENFAPYALAGNSGTDFEALSLAPGAYELSATPFSKAGKRGEAGKFRSISFTLINNGQRIVDLRLIDGQTGEAVRSLTNGTRINTSEFEEGFSIEALTSPPTVGSVVFEINGERIRVENVAPYAIAGNSGSDFNALDLAPGTYTLDVIPFAEANARGEAGRSTRVTFEVITRDEDIVIQEFRYNENDRVEIANQGAESRDISEWFLCANRVYWKLSTLTVEEGSLNIAPGASVILSGLTLPDASGDVALYRINQFANPDEIRDYVQYGSGDNTNDRESVAVAAGIWTDNDFVPAVALGNSIEYDGEGNLSSDYFEQDNPTLADETEEAVIRLVHLDLLTEKVSIQNQGDASEDITDYQLCIGFGQYNVISNYTEIEGDLMLEPGEMVTINILSGSLGITALPDEQGGLSLFANSNFGSSSPEDLKDYVQWGAPQQHRVGQAVEAGRWDDAEAFLSGAAPYQFVGGAADFGSTFWIDDTAIRMLTIDFEEDVVVLKNFDEVSRDVSGYFFCTQAGVYPQLGNASQVEVLSGDLELAPREEVRVKVLTPGGVLDDEGSVFLFSSSVLGFNNQNASVTRDFAQWGAPSGFRADNAVATGRWDAADSFIAGTTPFHYVGDADDIGAAFWEATAERPIIRLTHVDPIAETVTIKNLGNAEQNISSYQFCLGPGQYNVLSNYASVDGDLTLSASEEVSIAITSGSLGVSALPDENGALALFANTNFGSQSPDDLKDYIQWGAANQSRVNQGVAAGRWDDANNFVSGTAPYQFIGASDDFGSVFWEASNRQGLSVFPNPGQSTVNIAAKPGSVYTIYNEQGQSLKTGALEEGRRQVSLPAGQYFIKVDKEMKRLIVE